MAFPNKPQPTANPQTSGEKKPAAPASAPAEAKQKPKAKPKPPSAWTWGPAARVLASAAILFHLLAVFAAPWNIQLTGAVVPMVEPGGMPRDAQGRLVPPEQMKQEMWQRPLLPRLLNQNLVIRHYSNLLYINSAYNFFSPDPGVSHLIRYEITNDKGEKVAEGQLPDRRDEWPRLLYHRYMMLVEQSNDVDRIGARPPNWEYRIAEQLMRKFGGTQIKMTLLRHHLLTPQQVKAGARLDAPSTYEVLVGPIQHRLPASDQALAITPGRGQ
jgi:hypothetical protein